MSTTVFMLLCFFFISFRSSQAAVSPPEKYGGDLVLATTSDPKSFNPILAKEQSTSVILSVMFEGLTTTDAFDLRVKPNLAERWEVSADGLEWKFFLRPGLRWSDGVPLTADDVVFTFNELIFNDAVPNSARDVFTIGGKPIRVEKIDGLTVRFNLPVRFAPFLRGMGQEILPRHVLEASVKAGRFNYTWGIDTPVTQIVGTGPFRMVQYLPGQKVIYEPNPFYWKKTSDGAKLPFIGRLTYMIVPSEDVGMLKFMEGSIDSYSLRGMDYPLLKPREARGNFQIYELGPDMGSKFVVFNQNPGINSKTGKPYVARYKLKWFQNVLFRRAVAYAVDRKRIIEIVKNGLGYAQYSPESPSVGFFYNDKVPRYDYDLKRAAQLLAEAGFQDTNRDGFLEDGEGNTLEFNLYTSAGNTEQVDIASIIRNDLESLGLKVNLQIVEFNTLVSKLTSTFDWEAVVLGLTGTIDPHFGQNVWLSSGQLHMWNPKQKAPATDWERRLDELFELGAAELDENKRKEYYDEYQYIVADEVPMVYTALSARLSAVRNKFENLRPTIYGVFHNIEEISIKPEYR